MSESLGKKLKRIRESRHFSIEEVSERSRIHKNIICAIEEDRIDELKSGFYAKSFVKTYAVFLGALDEEGVREYLAMSQKKPEAVSKPITANKPVSGPNREKIAPRQKAPSACPERGRGVKTGMNGAGSGFAQANPAIKDATAVLRQAQSFTSSDNPDTRFSMIRKMFYTFLYHKKQILAIVIGIFIFWALSLAIGQIAKFTKKISAKKQDKQAVVKKEVPKKPEKQKPKNAIKGIEKEISSEKSDSIELEVSASDNTWLQIIADGELIFTGLFKKGSKDAWKARREIKLEAGNSGAVKVNVNGKPAGFSGKKGEKKEIIVTKDGIK